MVSFKLSELQAEYLELVNCRLPATAVSKNLPVRLNHCFGRIILDTVCGDCWYNVLTRGGRIPAYKQLTLAQLQLAIEIGQAILAQPQGYTVELNRQSLAWRTIRASAAN